MICTGCGAQNPDDALACQACGRKLQTGREERPDAFDPKRPGDRDPVPLLAARRAHAGTRLRPYIEAWLVALAVWAGCYLLVGAELYWPLYPLAGAAAGYGWLRGIR